MGFKWENVSLMAAQSAKLFAGNVGQGHLPGSTSLEQCNLLHHTSS